jgi:hypothetical protein
MQIKTLLWHICIVNVLLRWVLIYDVMIVLVWNSLAGSSLQVMGLHGSKNDQWSVMGGTGQLTMARGIINYNITQSTSASRTFEVYIYVYYTSLWYHSGKCQMHFYILILPLSKLSLLFKTFCFFIFKENRISTTRIRRCGHTYISKLVSLIKLNSPITLRNFAPMHS